MSHPSHRPGSSPTFASFPQPAIRWEEEDGLVRAVHDGPCVFVDGQCSCGILDLGIVREGIDRPVVAVCNPTVDDDTGAPVEVREALVVTCSSCGDLTDWESLGARRALQVQARRHAHDVHDDDVQAEGWTR